MCRLIWECSVTVTSTRDLHLTWFSNHWSIVLKIIYLRINNYIALLKRFFYLKVWSSFRFCSFSVTQSYQYLTTIYDYWCVQLEFKLSSMAVICSCSTGRGIFQITFLIITGAHIKLLTLRFLYIIINTHK